MFLFDLHCDTLTEVNDKGRGLLNDKFEVSLDRMPPDWQWCQCFAIFIEDQYRGAAAFKQFERHARFFRAQMNTHLRRVQMVRTSKDIANALENGRVAAMLTVESGAAIGGDIQNIKELARMGVRIMTVTWNAANELAGGCATEEGLSFFGRMALGVLEQNGIILDVSHSSPRTFWDIDGLAKRPYIATHSNAYTVCAHRRNLSDRQFEAIKNHGGLVGLTFHIPFVKQEGEDYDFDDFCKHIDHFRSLDGDDVLALGSDFDGGRLPSWMKGVQDVPMLAEMLTERYGEEFTQKLMGENVMRFLRRYEALETLLGALGR